MNDEWAAIARQKDPDWTNVTPVVPTAVKSIGPVLSANPVAGNKGEYAVACVRPDMIAEGHEHRAYGTITVKHDGERWVSTDQGYYGLTYDEALGIAIIRSKQFAL